MSKLFEEAILDSKKLKELAEVEAKKAIMENLSPYIKKMIKDQVAGKKTTLLLEEDDLEQGMTTGVANPPLDANSNAGDEPSAGSLAPTQVAAPGDTPPLPPMAPPVAPITPAAPPANPEITPPIQPAGEDLMNMPMPDEEGKIVIDFEQLFTPSTSSAAPIVPATPELGASPLPPSDMSPTPSPDLAATPGAPPVVPPPETTAGMVPPPSPEQPMTPPAKNQEYNLFQESVRNISKKIHSVFIAKKHPMFIKEALKENLFGLYEDLNKLDIPNKLRQINEKRLEFLYLKLGETLKEDNYSRVKENIMKLDHLKELANELLKEDVVETEEKRKDGVAMSAGAHAIKKTEPHVEINDTPKEKVGLDVSGDASYQKEMKELEEDIKMTLETAEGEEDESKKLGECGEEKEELDECPQECANIKECPLAKAKGSKAPVKEASMGFGDKGADVGKGNTAGGFGDGKNAKTPAAAKDYPVPAKMHETKKSEDVVLEISDAELKEAVSKIRKESIVRKAAKLRTIKEDAGMPPMSPASPAPEADAELEEETVVNFNFDLDNMGAGGGELGTAEEPMSDDETLDVVDNMGGETKEPGLETSPEEGREEVLGIGDKEEEEEEEEEMMALAENKKLRKQLAETQLFTAKNIYLNKFLQEKNLNKTQMRKIAEWLDRAKTLNEAKVIYGKIKNGLKEAAAAPKKSGSSSQPTNSRPLNEGVSSANSSVPTEIRNRWMVIAGIKKTS